MCDGGRAQKALLAAQNSNLAQQLPDVQKDVATIRLCLPQYGYKLSSDFESGLQDFCCHLMESAREIVQSRQHGLGGSVSGALGLSEQIFQFFKSELSKELPNP